MVPVSYLMSEVACHVMIGISTTGSDDTNLDPPLGMINRMGVCFLSPVVRDSITLSP